MKRFFLTLCTFLLLTWQALGADITILHTNDMHCNIESGVELSSVVWLKKIYQNAGLPVILVDAGDSVQGGTLGTLTRGKAIVRLMNAAGYDVAVPGNHEFDYGLEDFKFLNELLNCHYISANITENNKPLLPGYKIVEAGGVKIGFVGATTPATLVSSRPSSFFDGQNPRKQIIGFGEKGKFVKMIQGAINKAREQGAAKVVLMAHFGWHGSQCSLDDLVKQIKGVDVVIDGHSHENYLRQVPDATGKLITATQTGTGLQSLGRIVFKEDGTVVADKISQLSGRDEAFLRSLEFEKNAYDEVLHAWVGYLGCSLYANHPESGLRMVRCRETNLGDFIADAYRSLMGTDVAIVNGGGIRGNLAKGDLIYRDILTVFPFGNKVCAVKVTGKELLEILEFAVSRYPEESGAFLQVSGMSFEINPKRPSPVVRDGEGRFLKLKGGKGRVQNVLVGGLPLRRDAVYSLAGSDFTLKDGGDGYSMFREKRDRRESILTDGDVLVDFIHNKSGGTVSEAYGFYGGQGRIRFVN